MGASATRFDKISSNFVTSEVHKSSPTIARLHELVDGQSVKSVCDVACGAGHLGLSFSGCDSTIVCVDPSASMLKAAQQLAEEKGVHVEVHIGFAEHLPLADDRFDLVASRLAPHHFQDIQAAVREMTRIARPGGAVAVIDLHGNDNTGYDEFNHRLEVLHDPTHVRSYMADHWLRVFEAADLQIEAFERDLSERPTGVPVKRWCEIASSGVEAEREIDRLLAEADKAMLASLGIKEVDGVFLMPIRTVLIVGRKRS